MDARVRYILNLLSWHASAEEQAEGLRLAAEMDDLSGFLHPYEVGESHQRAWENCARVFAGQPDERLIPYLLGLLQWLQDLNWPGALCVMERLARYPESEAFRNAFETSVRQALDADDGEWLDFLRELEERRRRNT